MASIDAFGDFVGWVQHFQQERKAPVFKPKVAKGALSQVEEEVHRLRAVLYATEEGNFGATENGYLAGLKSKGPPPHRAEGSRVAAIPCSYEDFVREMLGERDDRCETLVSLLKYCHMCKKWCFDVRNCHECRTQLSSTKTTWASIYTCIIYRSGEARWLTDPLIVDYAEGSRAPQIAPSGSQRADNGLHYSSPLPQIVPSASPMPGQCANTALRCLLCDKIVSEEEAHEDECPDERIRVRATPNVLTSFIYGLETLDEQPLMLDVRYEGEDFILIDDPLNICMFHTNCIPTQFFIPDWRTLLTNPARGLSLIDRMVHVGFEAIKTAWEDERWRTLMSPVGDYFSHDDIRVNMITGFAVPSNQRQLALQILCPPFTPRQYRRLLAQEEFVYKQWFPIEYVCKILTLCVRRGIRLTAEDVSMPIDALIAFFDDIPYDAIHTKALQRYARLHRQLADFPLDNFQFIVGDEKLVPTSKDPTSLPADRDTLREHDRKLFTPSGSTRKFYKYPKQYPLPHWV